MYRNVLGEKVSRKRYREMLAAAKNRRELIAAGLGRRELLKMGLLSGTGMLLPIKGLSGRAFAQQRIANAQSEAGTQRCKGTEHLAYRKLQDDVLKTNHKERSCGKLSWTFAYRHGHGPIF